MPDTALPPPIRDATAADAPGIAAIWTPIIRDTAITFWPTPRSEAEIADLIAQRQAAGWAFLVVSSPASTGPVGSGPVASTPPDILGFASFFQFRGGPGYARSMELTINLAPEARGRGLGTALLRALETRATAAGARLMIGAVTASNSGSIAFHRRCGYAEMGRLPQAGWKFGRFHDLVLMGRLLPPVPPAFGDDSPAPPG